MGHNKTRNLQRMFVRTVLVIGALQFGLVGESQGDIVVTVFDNTGAGTVDISYSGTFDVAGLGTPTDSRYVDYAYSAGGFGAGGVVYITNPLDADTDGYTMADLTPISGTTMGPGNGSFNILTSSAGSGDQFVFDDASVPTTVGVDVGFTSGSISGSTSVAGSFASFGITAGFADVVYLLPNTAGDTITFTTSPVPEPSSLGLLCVALVGLVSQRWRR